MYGCSLDCFDWSLAKIDIRKNSLYINSLKSENFRDFFVNKSKCSYGTTAVLIGTDYETGWYVPSVAELIEVSINKDVIQKSLTVASGSGFYWSSSQTNESCFSAGTVIFDDTGNYDSVSNYSKDADGFVFVLHDLNAE